MYSYFLGDRKFDIGLILSEWVRVSNHPTTVWTCAPARGCEAIRRGDPATGTADGREKDQTAGLPAGECGMKTGIQKRFRNRNRGDDKNERHQQRGARFYPDCRNRPDTGFPPQPETVGTGDNNRRFFSPRTNHFSNISSTKHRRATESPPGKGLFLLVPADRSRVRLRPVRGIGTLPDAGGAGGGGHAPCFPCLHPAVKRGVRGRKSGS